MAKNVWVLLLLMNGTLRLLAGDPGSRAHLIGGTVAELAGKSEGRMDMTGEEAFLFRTGRVTLRISYEKINTLEYGQRVNRRYAEAILISPLLLVSKARKHFVTIGYTDDQGRQQALVFRVGKGDVRSVLAGLEAKTGRKVEYQDEEARKTGKG